MSVTRAGEVRFSAALIAATGHQRALLREVSALWDAAADAGPLDLPARVGLILDRLAPADAPLLFAADRREHRLQALLDAVRERYAAPALRLGPLRASGGALHQREDRVSELPRQGAAALARNRVASVRSTASGSFPSRSVSAPRARPAFRFC